MGKKDNNKKLKNVAPAAVASSPAAAPVEGNEQTTTVVNPTVNATMGGTPREEPPVCSSGNHHEAAATQPIALKKVDQVKAGCQTVRNGGKNSNLSKGNLVNTWASLFKNNRSSATGAALTQVYDGIELEGIHFDIDEIEEDSQVSRSLIGFFSSKFPGMDAIKQLTETWKYKCKIFRHASSWTVFTFPSKEEALGVLEAGPYQIFGNVLHLKAMPKLFNFNREAQQDVPVWIQLHNLPLEFWKPRLLSKLCTFIGQPLHTDHLTSTRERISFARCLVQVPVNLQLPTVLTLHLPGGVILEQPVLYENKPLCCTKCKRLGHDEIACRDTGIPKLYVMKKPNGNQGKKKVNAASAPIDTWVQVGKEKEVDTNAQMDATADVQAEDGSEDDYSESENEENEVEDEDNEENETEEEDNDENSEEDSDDGEPEEEAEDREPPVVVVFKATAPTPTPSPSPSAPSPTPLILKGDRSPPREPPQGMIYRWMSMEDGNYFPSGLLFRMLPHFPGLPDLE